MGISISLKETVLLCSGAYLTGERFCYTLKLPTHEARLPPAAAPKARPCRYMLFLQPTALGRFRRYDVRVSVRSRQLVCWGASCRLFYSPIPTHEVFMSQLFPVPPTPLLDIESNLSPLPDRLRLLVAAVLTEPAFCRTLNFPNTKRPCRSLCQRPRAGANRGVFAFLPSARLYGQRYILAEQRPVSVRTGGLFVAGERCSAFFCTL